MEVCRKKNGHITKEYRAWKAMKARCYSPCNKDVGFYQRLSINVCERWRNSFENFIEDMGKSPFGMSLDRIDPLKDYEPGNCRWADSFTQSNNRGEFNHVFKYNGETHTLKEWSRILNIGYSKLYYRAIKKGMSFEKAISEDPYNRLISFNGEELFLADWCRRYNIKYQIVIDRIISGWNIGDALTKPKSK